MMRREAFSGEDVTLYVPCYNADQLLSECLKGIRSQTVTPGRVVLIDDGSTVPLTDTGFEVAGHQKNRGLACARNTALKICRSSLVASLDADVVPANDWLERMLAGMNSGDWAGVGGCMVERNRATVADRWRSVHMAQNWGDQPVGNPRFLFGANTLFSVEALRSVGGYDERFRTNNEDRTICEALYSRGDSLRYLPDAKCEHLRRDTMQSILNSYWNWHQAKGLIEGDYDSIEGIISRISRVNFGIFRYRFDKDFCEDRWDGLDLDMLIPWVFCARDLDLFSSRTGAPAPSIITEILTRRLPAELRNLLRTVLPGVFSGRSLTALVYADAFRAELEGGGWLSRLDKYTSIRAAV